MPRRRSSARAGATCLQLNGSRTKTYYRNFSYNRTIKFSANTPQLVEMSLSDVLGSSQSASCVDWFSEFRMGHCKCTAMNMVAASDVDNVVVYVVPHSGSRVYPANAPEMRRCSGLRACTLSRIDFKFVQLGSVVLKRSVAATTDYVSRFTPLNGPTVGTQYNSFAIMTDRPCSLDLDFNVGIEFRGAQ